ncbi:MAG: ester cyclase [Nitrososphaeraceae archaeon]
MSSSTNKALVKSFVEDVLNKHDLSAIEKYFGKDSIQDSPLVGNGCEGFKQFLSAFFTAFPDMHTNIERIVAENNLVVVFLNGSGTHKGEFQGMPPTNKKINIRSADLYRIENEKIVEHWDVVDQLNLLQQTGATLSQVNKK